VGQKGGISIMLSCTCTEWYGEGWYYWPPNDFTTLQSKLSRKCCSCNKRIKVGDECVKFLRSRAPRSDIEERIHGDEVPLAPWYMCQWCGEMYLTLEELGYCHGLGDSMVETMQEYWDMTGFKLMSRGCN